MYAALKLRTYEPLRSNAHGHGKESTTKGATPASPPRREKKSKLGRSKTASPLEKDPTVASRAALRSPYIATPFSIDAAHGPPNHAKAAVQSGVATAPAADAGLPTVLSSSFNFPKQGGAVWVSFLFFSSASFHFTRRLSAPTSPAQAVVVLFTAVHCSLSGHISHLRLLLYLTGRASWYPFRRFIF
uniref:Uncharacterized protein n=1 Tax=Palpitomonas bilix TaxID=652834 RepID=A0A7S3DIY2_9EUKA